MGSLRHILRGGGRGGPCGRLNGRLMSVGGGDRRRGILHREKEGGERGRERRRVRGKNRQKVMYMYVYIHVAQRIHVCVYVHKMLASSPGSPVFSMYGWE